MAFRLYIVPIIGAGVKGDPRRPKYFADGTVLSPWSGIDYGVERWQLVGADLSVTDDATVAAAPDAMALPFDLTQLLTAPQVTTVQNKLEAINLPALWVDTTFTWVQVVRIVCGILSFMQRFSVLNNNVSLFQTGVTLSTTLGSLPAAVRNTLLQAATEMGLDTSSIVGSATIRTALKILGSQMSNKTISLLGVTI